MSKFYYLIITNILLIIGISGFMPIIKSSFYTIARNGTYYPHPTQFFCPQNFGLSNYGEIVGVELLLIMLVWLGTLILVKNQRDVGKLTLAMAIFMVLLSGYTFMFSNNLWNSDPIHGLEAFGFIFYTLSEVGLFLFAIFNFILAYYILKKNSGYISAKIVLFVDLIALMMAFSILNIF